MADLPSSVGWLTVKGRLVLAIGDSTDAGSQPDLIPTIGTVTFTANVRGNDPLVVVPDSLMIALAPIKATLNANGVIVPPADGESSDPAFPTDDDTAEEATGVVLVAPQQPDVLNITDWTWTATLTPATGQKWRTFSRVFTGAPGDVIDLAVVVASSPAAGVSQALIYEVLTTAEPYPTGFRPGTDWLLTPDGNIWSVDA